MNALNENAGRSHMKWHSSKRYSLRVIDCDYDAVMIVQPYIFTWIEEPWLFRQCAKDQCVGDNHGDEGQSVEEQYGDTAVELLLPASRVSSVCDALVEVLYEWASEDAENEQLQNKNRARYL